MQNKLIKNISVLLSLFMICLFNINITYANNSKDIPTGDDPHYQLETTYEFYNENIESIKTLIKKYNIKITSEEDIQVIGEKEDKPSLQLIMEVPKDNYGNFIKDLKEMTKTNKTIKITESYEPMSLGADNRTLTLKIMQYSKYDHLIAIGLGTLFIIGIILALTWND